MKQYEGVIVRITRERKEDLKMVRYGPNITPNGANHCIHNQLNHLAGHMRLLLQIHFHNVSDLLTVRRDLLPLAQANNAKLTALDAFAEVVGSTSRMQVDFEGEAPWGAEAESTAEKHNRQADPRELIIDIREYDVPYYLRVAIDNGTRYVGLAFDST